jgi:hypothetical protein
LGLGGSFSLLQVAQRLYERLSAWSRSPFSFCRDPIPSLGHLAPLPSHVSELPAGFGVNNLPGAQLALGRLHAIFVCFGCHSCRQSVTGLRTLKRNELFRLGPAERTPYADGRCWGGPPNPLNPAHLVPSCWGIAAASGGQRSPNEEQESSRRRAPEVAPRTHTGALPLSAIADAGVAELVDARDLGSRDESRGGSNPSARTTPRDGRALQPILRTQRAETLFY